MYLLTKLKIYYFIPLRKYWIKISKVGKSPHGPVVKIPTQWTKTLEAASCGQKRKKKLVNLILQFKLDSLTKHSLALTSLFECPIPFPNN